MTDPQATPWRHLAHTLGWTRSSTVLISAFVATLALIGVVWWPLAEQQLDLIDWNVPLWRQVDWLLLFDFGLMSLLIVAGADLRADVWLVLVGLCGGLVIESWGTQTELWSYYTLERPPLWIIPAWPIAALSFNRLARILDLLVPGAEKPGPGAGKPAEAQTLVDRKDGNERRPWASRAFRVAYWLVFGSFLALLLRFVWPAIDQPLTIMAVVLCALFVLSPTDHRLALLTFAGGMGLGSLLEWWGTTRQCWTYYTEFRPPLFAVMAHGMAAVAFWRTRLLLGIVWSRIASRGARPG